MFDIGFWLSMVESYNQGNCIYWHLHKAGASNKRAPVFIGILNPSVLRWTKQASNKP